MNHTKNNKRSKLTRQGISFLLAFVLMLSVFAPGAAYATGETEPMEISTCGHCHVELKGGGNGSFRGLPCKLQVCSCSC